MLRKAIDSCLPLSPYELKLTEEGRDRLFRGKSFLFGGEIIGVSTTKCYSNDSDTYVTFRNTVSRLIGGQETLCGTGDADYTVPCPLSIQEEKINDARRLNRANRVERYARTIVASGLAAVALGSLGGFAAVELGHNSSADHPQSAASTSAK